MSRYNKPIDFHKKDIILQGVVLAATIALLVWFLPNGRTSLRYEKGQPWPYNQIIANYQFPILKSDTQWKHELDSIRRLYEPYLQLSPQVETNQVNRFRSDFRQASPLEIPVSYRSFVEARLHQVYARGIISNDDLETLTADTVTDVKVYSGTEAQSRPLARLMTQKAAYEFLLANADSMGVSKQKLQKLNLNNYLEPNLTYDEPKSNAEWQGLVGSLAPSKGVVVAGESIVDRGQMVDESTYQKLKSYEHAMAKYCILRSSASACCSTSTCSAGIMWTALAAWPCC